MNLEVKRLDPVQTAKIAALVQCAIGLGTTLVMVPLILLTTSLGSQFSFLGTGGSVLLALTPVTALVTGWISGFVGSHTYNYIVRWTGALRIEVSTTEFAPAPLVQSPTA
ncbi:MAG TPA: hypothetical protein VK843_13020 [Planctomycetota bacterium]|nr:hypothetical protein [Planctomycetota bacterium]